jgi:hypothetical protein
MKGKKPVNRRERTRRLEQRARDLHKETGQGHQEVRSEPCLGPATVSDS